MQSNWFSWKSWAAGVVCGLGAFALVGAAAPTGEPGRWQLHVWATRGTDGSVNGMSQQAQHGAYRIDTQTGEVYEIGAPSATGAQKVIFQGIER